MCWAHVRINVVKQTSLLSNKKIKNEIMADLNLVQLSPDNETFKKSFELFCKKHVAEERFLKYIKKEWIDKNGKWYEGASWFMPSTNNALESSNRIIKDQHTLRERLPVSKFKVVLAEMVAGWSISYKNNLKIFKKIPTIDLPLWTSSYQWAKLNKKLIATKTGDLTVYNFAAKNENDLGEMKKLEDWLSFDDYKLFGFNNWTIQIKGEDWRQSKCNCPAFMKKYICKHTVGLAIRLKYVKAPPEAKNVKMEEKRKRGRPSKAKKALLVQ